MGDSMNSNSPCEIQRGEGRWEEATSKKPMPFETVTASPYL